MHVKGGPVGIIAVVKIASVSVELVREDEGVLVAVLSGLGVDVLRGVAVDEASEVCNVWDLTCRVGVECRGG